MINRNQNTDTSELEPFVKEYVTTLLTNAVNNYVKEEELKIAEAKALRNKALEDMAQLVKDHRSLSAYNKSILQKPNGLSALVEGFIRIEDILNYQYTAPYSGVYSSYYPSESEKESQKKKTEDSYRASQILNSLIDSKNFAVIMEEKLVNLDYILYASMNLKTFEHYISDGGIYLLRKKAFQPLLWNYAEIFCSESATQVFQENLIPLEEAIKFVTIEPTTRSFNRPTLDVTRVKILGELLSPGGLTLLRNKKINLSMIIQYKGIDLVSNLKVLTSPVGLKAFEDNRIVLEKTSPESELLAKGFISLNFAIHLPNNSMYPINSKNLHLFLLPITKKAIDENLFPVSEFRRFSIECITELLTENGLAAIKCGYIDFEELININMPIHKLHALLSDQRIFAPKMKNLPPLISLEEAMELDNESTATAYRPTAVISLMPYNKKKTNTKATKKALDLVIQHALPELANKKISIEDVKLIKDPNILEFLLSREGLAARYDDISLLRFEHVAYFLEVSEFIDNLAFLKLCFSLPARRIFQDKLTTLYQIYSFGLNMDNLKILLSPHGYIALSNGMKLPENCSETELLESIYQFSSRPRSDTFKNYILTPEEQTLLTQVETKIKQAAEFHLFMAQDKKAEFNSAAQDLFKKIDGLEKFKMTYFSYADLHVDSKHNLILLKLRSLDKFFTEMTEALNGFKQTYSYVNIEILFAAKLLYVDLIKDYLNTPKTTEDLITTLQFGFIENKGKLLHFNDAEQAVSNKPFSFFKPESPFKPLEDARKLVAAAREKLTQQNKSELN